MNQTDPIITLVILLLAALVGGMVVHRLRQPLILGYLIIGIAVGPHALGLASDLELIRTAATIGVALLMLTLGLEVSLSQLRQIGPVGVWGGIAQIILSFGLGFLAGVTLFRWPVAQAVLFGLIISLSSTAVCFKILMDRAELDSQHGRIMISILIVQDIAVVLMMIITPLLAGQMDNLLLGLFQAIVKAILLIGVAIVSGLWVLPWLMGRIGGVRSRELFLLVILVFSLGAALGTQVFGLSMVFGAFLVGLVMRETRFAHQALAEITPLRDIFATLFFVSLGMLLSPIFVVEHWRSVLIMVGVIIIIKLLVVFGVIRMFGFNGRIAFLTSAGLFQVGEFGFILAQGGMDAGLISEQFYSLIIAGAITTMLLTPVSLSLVSRLEPRLMRYPVYRRLSANMESRPYVEYLDVPATEKHVVIAGYGRIGQSIAQSLQHAGIPYIVIDIDAERISDAHKSGVPCIYGDASNPHVLSQANLTRASALVVVFPDPLAVVAAVRAALEINPRLRIVARVHRAREADMLRRMGNVEAVSPEYEASREFTRRILVTSGWKDADIANVMDSVEETKESIEFATDEKT